MLYARALDDEHCCRSVETFNTSVENMMSIKSFVEIKESAAAPWPPPGRLLSAPSQSTVRLSVRLPVRDVVELRQNG